MVTGLARVVSLLGLACAACGTAPEPFLPAAFLGRWESTGSSGGLTGGGIGEVSAGWIELRADGTIEQHAADGTLTGTTHVTAARGRTIFSTEDLWILDRGDGAPQVIQLSEDGQTMTLSENVYDGFSRHYARSR